MADRQRARMRHITAVLVLVSLAACDASTPSLAKAGRPWQHGQAVSDPLLTELLQPDEAFENSALRRGADGRVYYVALSRRDLPSDYHKRYLALIQGRGVLISSDYGNPHVLPRRIRSYNFVVIRNGPVRPFTLRYRRFQDTDAAWLEAERLRNLPHPLAVSGRELVLRLPPEALQPWKETVLIPERDLVDVTELPFPRFPGAVLKSGVVPEEDRDLAEYPKVSRSYVSVGASIHDVIEHYRRVMRAYGIPVTQLANSPRAIAWWGGRQSRRNLTQVSVEGRDFAPIPGSDLTLDTIGRFAPELLRDFPRDAVTFRVLLAFADAKLAVPYWSAADQMRWKRLKELGGAVE